MRYISIGLIFFSLPFISNLKIWLLFFGVFLAIVLSLSSRYLRLAGEKRIWISLSLFLLLMSFDFPSLEFSLVALTRNLRILLHFYSFNVVINILNDRIRVKDLYDVMMKRGMIKSAFYVVFLVVVFRKISSRIYEIFSYYISQNKGLRLMKNIDKLFYCCIREAVKASYSLSENFVIRRIYEKG